MKLTMEVIGHIGADCVVRDVPGSNQRAIGFSVAHSEKYRDAQGVQQETTRWINCTLWRQADKMGISEYLRKGQLVAVSGNPSAAGYLGRDGVVRGELKLKVLEVTLLGAQRPQVQDGQPQATPGNVPRMENLTTTTANSLPRFDNPPPMPYAPPPASGGDDDLPF